MFYREQQSSHKHLSRAVWILEMRIRGFKVANASLGPLVSYQLCNDLDPGLPNPSHHVFHSRNQVTLGAPAEEFYVNYKNLVH